MMTIPNNFLKLWTIWLVLFALSSCSLTPEQSKETSFDLLLLGDLGFGENYQLRRSQKGEENILETRIYAASFRLLEPLLQESLVIIANLEGPLCLPDYDSPHINKKKYIHWSQPDSASAILRQLGITAVALGNNHSLDYGERGLLSTAKVLTHKEIAYFGAGKNHEEAQKPFYTEVLNQTSDRHIYVINGFEFRKDYDEDYHFYAGEQKAGVLALDAEQISQQINSIKKNDSKAFVIVYPHWGGNYKWKNKKQSRLAHTLIRTGADLIVGHGAHTCQEIERYQNKWIIYNIGNFVFNSPGRFYKSKTLPYGMAVALQFENNEPLISLFPIKSDNRKTDYHPSFLKGDELTKMATRLTEKSNLSGHLYRIHEESIQLLN